MYGPRWRPAAALALLLTAPACGARERPAMPAAVTAPADKAALFGDPSLVPTRAGERARAEVARAAEIERALSVLPEVAAARVDVEHPTTTEPTRVLAVVRIHDHADLERIRAHAGTIVDTVIGPRTQATVIVEPGPAAPAPAPAASPRWLLMLSMLGLGLCSGVLFERLRRLRARSREGSPRSPSHLA